jgi:hypothetical protein
VRRLISPHCARSEWGMATSLHHGSNIGIHDKNMFGPCRNAVQILLKTSQLFFLTKIHGIWEYINSKFMNEIKKTKD